MSAGRNSDRRQLPILTEVVATSQHRGGADPESGPDEVCAPAIDAGELERRLLEELQFRCSAALEGPLRTAVESLADGLADTLLREARGRLEDSMRAMVREAIDRELAGRSVR